MRFLSVFICSLTFCLGGLAYAEVPKVLFLNLGATTWIKMVPVGPQNIIVSKICLARKNCEALSAIEKAKKLRLQLIGQWQGAEPGAELCRRLSKTKLRMGMDSNRVQTGLCRFEDGSYITTASLYQASLK